MGRHFDHLGDVEALITVVEKGSMTEGAVALATTPSVVSRAIRRLEARLGTQLLRRTTRQLHLTEAGRLYLDQAKSAFSTIAEAERAIRGQSEQIEVTGRVRMSVPTTYGHYRLPKMLRRFNEAYPQVQIELSIANRNVDLLAEGYDLAIRLGHLRDSGLSSLKLEDAPLRLVASPEYLRRHGTPSNLEELQEHMLLPFIMPSTGRYGPWLIRIDGEIREWIAESKIRVTDDVLGCVSLAEHGVGICQTYDFIVHERIAQGRLVEILPELGGGSRPFSMLFAAHEHLPVPTRRLIDVLAEEARQPCMA
jgi:DNA-binding transcriptional LysR family regulator